jgi:hypothetical protein
MKRQYLNVLFTVICVLGLGLGARAQVKIPLLQKCRTTS